MIKISYLDDVHCKVECEASIAQELSDFFTFEVPGAKFMPQVRNRVWDGKIRLFNQVTRTIYVGLTNYIVDFCRVREYKYDIDGKISVHFSFHQLLLVSLSSSICLQDIIQ